MLSFILEKQNSENILNIAFQQRNKKQTTNIHNLFLEKAIAKLKTKIMDTSATLVWKTSDFLSRLNFAILIKISPVFLNKKYK